MKKIIVFIFLVFLNISHAQTSPLLLPKKPKNCFITVTSNFKTGEVTKKTRMFFYETKDKCEKMKRILSDNFSPREILKVGTSMEWTGHEK